MDYASGFMPASRAAQLADTYVDLEPGVSTDEVTSVAGRVVAKRDQGKILFLVIRDATGDLQLFIRANALDEEGFARAMSFGVGDWIFAEGTVLRTRRGELSVQPARLELLSKALRTLPEKFHGLTDTETRYRQRYVDLIANPEVRETFLMRFKIISAIRRYMEEQGYLEVETPMLHPIAGGAVARPFVTHHNTLDMPLYLRIAPELYLKRLLVGGFEKVFEINRSFRNEGLSTRHNPEFTMIEMYQAYGSMETMMELAEGLITTVAQEILGTLELSYQDRAVSLASPWRRVTMDELISERLQRPLSAHSSVDELRALCDEHEIFYEDSYGSGKLLLELFEKLVETTLWEPTFVYRYPAEVSPLSRRNEEDPIYCDRFELFIAGREFANAFSELIDPVDQRQRFEDQARAKAAGDMEAMSVDEDYLRAQEYGMPPAGGMGIGIDRLVMLLTDSASIRDVLLFPQMRPETGEPEAG
ncbi:MAG: lysine--tRNA ligase [Coriobacteriia bacterium]|nr:lysine--tRNA ligase [Coriobacteriia bacterium]